MSEKEGKYMMQAEEFINIACNSGYATKMNAKKYTEKHTKDSYSDQDFIDVYRFNEEKKEIDHTHCTSHLRIMRYHDNCLLIFR